MKTALYIGVFFSFVLFVGCNKTLNTHLTANVSLVGKWFLIETLADPGDGSGKWNPADRPNYYFIKFNADNSIKSNTYGRLSGAKQYDATSDTTLNVRYADGTTATFYYSISNGQLTIMGGCIEACGLKFRKEGQ